MSAIMQRAVRYVRSMLLRRQLISALYALDDIDAHGDPNGVSGYWLDRIDSITRAIEELNSGETGSC